MGEIWLGDLARAWVATGARTSEERLAVARLLGLGDQPVEQADPYTVHEQDDGPPRPSRPARASSSRTSPGIRDKTAGGAAGSAADDEGVRKIGIEPVTVVRSTATLPRQGSTSGVRPHLPLIDPRLGRSVLHQLIARETHEGSIDVTELVGQVATRRVTGVPRRRSRTLRFGVQILSDEGDGMAPFARDQDDVVQQVRDLVGDDLTDVTYFADAPLRGAGQGPVWTWRRYQPPPGGRILLLSHLGIGGPWPDPGRARRREWEDFAALVRRAECRVVALVPYPLDRVPQWAHRLFSVACWDRTLTVGRAAQAQP